MGRDEIREIEELMKKAILDFIKKKEEDLVNDEEMLSVAFNEERKRVRTKRVEVTKSILEGLRKLQERAQSKFNFEEIKRGFHYWDLRHYKLYEVPYQDQTPGWRLHRFLKLGNAIRNVNHEYSMDALRRDSPESESDFRPEGVERDRPGGKSPSASPSVGPNDIVGPRKGQKNGTPSSCDMRALR